MDIYNIIRYHISAKFEKDIESINFLRTRWVKIILKNSITINKQVQSRHRTMEVGLWTLHPWPR